MEDKACTLPLPAPPSLPVLPPTPSLLAASPCLTTCWPRLPVLSWPCAARERCSALPAALSEVTPGLRDGSHFQRGSPGTLWPAQGIWRGVIVAGPGGVMEKRTSAPTAVARPAA